MTRPAWADFGPAEFDSSLLSARARKRALSEYERTRGQAGMFVVNRDPDRPRAATVTPELDGQGALFGDPE